MMICVKWHKRSKNIYLAIKETNKFKMEFSVGEVIQVNHITPTTAPRKLKTKQNQTENTKCRNNRKISLSIVNTLTLQSSWDRHTSYPSMVTYCRVKSLNQMYYSWCTGLFLANTKLPSIHTEKLRCNVDHYLYWKICIFYGNDTQRNWYEHHSKQVTYICPVNIVLEFPIHADIKNKANSPRHREQIVI